MFKYVCNKSNIEAAPRNLKNPREMLLLLQRNSGCNYIVITSKYGILCERNWS